jgi:hypothetical protein
MQILITIGPLAAATSFIRNARKIIMANLGTVWTGQPQKLRVAPVPAGGATHAAAGKAGNVPVEHPSTMESHH